jgi:hypothetical protein
MKFSAEVTIKTSRAITEDDLFELAEVGGVAVGRVGEFVLETTLTVAGRDVHEATQKAVKSVLDRVKGTVVAVEIMTTDEADRRLAEQPIYVGVTEVAHLLGVTKQRVSVLCRRRDFPAPVADLSAGPIWRKGDLSTFASGWERKPGRPRKALTN